MTPPPIRRTPSELVALTFDDGPDPAHTPRILDLLSAHGARATFFLVGEAAERHPGLVHRIVGEGHEVAVHGWSHRHPWLLPPGALRRQMVLGTRALTRMVESVPRWYRPPYGRVSPWMSQVARELDQEIVLWSRSAMDWGRWATPAWVRRRLMGVEPGDIVLMHDAGRGGNRPRSTLRALEGVMGVWLERGFRFGPPARGWLRPADPSRRGT